MLQHNIESSNFSINRYFYTYNTVRYYHKTKRSDVWKHFEKYGEEVKCLICKKNISCKGSTTTGLRNHLLIHNIQLGLDHISDNEPPSKKHSTQSLLPSFSKKQSLDEVIARLAAEDGFSYLKISQIKFIRSSLKEKGFTPIQDHSTVSRMVFEVCKSC